MKHLFYILSIYLSVFNLCAQANQDKYITALVNQYTVKPELKCDIFIKIDVEGMTIPNKKMTVDFRTGEKPKVTGKGLALLPKKGMIDQFSRLLSSPFQAIFLSETENTFTYKLVSLSQKSDWITADITFDKKTFVMYYTIISTRKNGTFYAEHTYNDTDNIYPSKSIIKFEIKKFKVPLKFIGREQKSTKETNKDKEVEGKITLVYTYL